MCLTKLCRNKNFTENIFVKTLYMKDLRVSLKTTNIQLNNVFFYKKTYLYRIEIR